MKSTLLKNISTALAALALCVSATTASGATISATSNAVGPITVGDTFTVDFVGSGFLLVASPFGAPGTTVGGGVNLTFNTPLSMTTLGGINLTTGPVIDPIWNFGSDVGVTDNIAGELAGLRVGTFPATALTDFAIATMEFTAMSAGTVELLLSEFSAWSDPNGVAINVTYEGSSVTVIPAAVPLPPAVLLFGSALVGLVSVRRKLA